MLSAVANVLCQLHSNLQMGNILSTCTQSKPVFAAECRCFVLSMLADSPVSSRETSGASMRGLETTGGA